MSFSLGLIILLMRFKSEHFSYQGAFFTEGWANRIGEWVIEEKFIDELVLD